MKTKSLFLTLVLLALGGSLFGQTLTPAGSSTGSITVNAANCNTTNACIILHMASSNVGYSVTVSGTWTGTLTVEQSGDNQGSWTSATTTTANTLFTSTLTPGITDVRVRGSAAMTGTAVVTITASGPATLQQITQTGSSSSSPSSLTTFFNKYYGLAPDDCGNVGCTTPVSPAIRYVKFCYDGVVTGQPTTTFKSLGTGTITNTSLTGNVATYTLSTSTVPFGPGELITVTGSTNGGGVFNITNQPILNFATGGTTFTVAITNANVGSAGDTGTATGSCANFQALDATSTIEVLAGGLATALDVSTTISAVVSASQVTLGANATTNATAKKFWYGTDATTPLQNWQNAINAGIPTATGLQTHSGYLPGLYLTTKPIRLVNPLGAFANGICQGVSGGGYGTPEPWNLDNANESLSVWGQGPYRSGIVSGSQFNWASAGTANNTGLFYFACWNGPTIANFAVLSPDYGIAYNTSTLTGKFGGFFDDANGHANVTGMEIENFHNTTSSLVGDQMFDGTFESVRNDIQVYNNDCAGVYGGSGAPAGNMRGISWNGYVWGGTRGSGCSPAAAVVLGNGGGGEYNSLHITNFILDNESGSADMPAGNGLINWASSGGGGMDDNDEWQFENGRIQTSTCNNFAISVNSAVGKLKAAFTNVNLTNTCAAATASTQLVLLQNATSDFNFFGGSLGVTGSATNGISVATGSTIHTHGTRQFGTIGIVGTGASGVSQMTPSATGWSGRGSWSASALTAVGTLSVTGTGACATITTTSGGAWAGQLTCTGTTGASTLVITPGITATNGWSCFASDQTTAANTLRQSANAATTCTIAGTVNQNDVLTFGAVGF